MFSNLLQGFFNLNMNIHFFSRSDNKYPEKGWGQNKPNFDDQKSSNGGHSGPPILPPHLLQVILNKVSSVFF